MKSSATVTRSGVLWMAFWWILAVFILNTIALRIDLYYMIPWFDVLMHTMGGVSLGILGAGISYTKGYRGWKVLVIGLAAGVLGGIAWEVLEYTLDVLVRSGLQPSIPDTISDLASDTIGSFIGFILIHRRM